MDGAGNPLVSHKTKGSKFELARLLPKGTQETAGLPSLENSKNKNINQLCLTEK